MSGFWTPERTAEARRLYVDEGFGAGQVAKRLGTTRTTVCGKAAREDWHLQRTGAVKMVHKMNSVAAAAKASREAREMHAPSIKAGPTPRKPKTPRNPIGLAWGSGGTTEPKPPSFPAAKPEHRTLDDTSLKVRLPDLGFSHCRFPTHEEGGEHLFCGHPKKPGSSYCEGHAARCVTATSSAKELTRALRRQIAA